MAILEMARGDLGDMNPATGMAEANNTKVLKTIFMMMNDDGSRSSHNEIMNAMPTTNN